MHYLRETDAHPHDVLLCIGTGKAFNDTERLRYDGEQFFLKTAEEMAAVFKDFPEALANTVRIAERCNVDLSETARTTCRTSTCRPGFTLDDYFEHVVARGLRAAAAAAAGSCRRAASLRHTIDEYERRLGYEIEMIKQMKYPGTS